MNGTYVHHRDMNDDIAPRDTSGSGDSTRSTCAILEAMTTVGLRELRQEASELVRRVESGEEIDITVAGRLAARLVPAAPRRWQHWNDIADLFTGRPDADWHRDRDLIDQSVTDPWERAGEGDS